MCIQEADGVMDIIRDVADRPKTPLPCAAQPSDHDQQQQDAKYNLELKANITSASSSADTAGAATHQSTAVQTDQFHHTEASQSASPYADGPCVFFMRRESFVA